MMIGNDDVVTVYVGYEENKGGKARPVLVVNTNYKYLDVYRLTTKYRAKSDYIKEQYYKVKKWREAGLYKQSWVDLGRLKQIPIRGVNIKRIGSLETDDILSMRHQLVEVATNRSVNRFRAMLSKKITHRLESFLEEQQIPKEAISFAGIVDKLTEKQIDFGKKELIKSIVENGEVNKDTVETLIREFVQENYSTDYLYMKIADEIDEESLRLKMIDKLVEELRFKHPYNAIKGSYWHSKVNQVKSIKELHSYAYMDNLADFTYKYASDWKEIRDEG